MTLDNTSIFFAREGNLLSQAWNKLNSDKRSNISFRLDNLDINYAENESWCLHEIARVKQELKALLDPEFLIITRFLELFGW